MGRTKTGADFGALLNSTVIVTAVAYGLLLKFAGFAGLFGLLLTIMIMLSLWRYGYAVLRYVAIGWNHFPPPDIESMNPFGDFAVIFHSLLFSLSIYLFATTPFVDGALRWLLLVAVLAVFPASAAVMAMTRNTVAALNPANLLGFVRDLGTDYAKLVFVSAALGFLTAFATWLEAKSWLLGIVGEIVAVWTVLALFLATGAALRAHRFEFDLVEGVDDAEQRALRQRHADWQKTLDHAYASVRGGLALQGYRTVKELVDREGDSLEVYQWAFNGMLAWDEPRHAALFGERFAARLWQAGRKVDALDLAQRCRKLSPAFVPPAAFVVELAGYARSLGRHRLADDLEASIGGGTAGDEARAAAVGEVLPEPAQRHHDGARHPDEKVDVRDAPEPPRRPTA
jgi:hypothetical protein